MGNQIQIDVTLNDGTAPTKAAIMAGLEEWAAGLEPIEIRATNPINEAFAAQVEEGLGSLEGESIEIPVAIDAEQATAQLQEALDAARETASIEVPLQAGNTDAFNADVLGDVEALRAEVGSIVVPVETDSAGLAQGSPGVADLTPESGTSGAGSFQPSYSPAPLFGGGEDPYAAARAQLANEAPLELPVRAANPIDDAWIAQVRSSVKSIASDAVAIPVNPDLEGFQSQLESTLAELATTTRADIPVDVGDAMIFREQVSDLVQQVENSVKAVIDVQVNNDGDLTDLQQKTVAASQATLDMVNAEQKLNEAMASGDEEQIAKARADVVTATTQESEASQELSTAMAAAAESETAAAGAADGAAFSMRALNEAMGPLWMVMNVAQIAMMGLFSSSGQTSTAAQDLSQQLIGLGESGSNAAQQLTGNDALKSIASDLTGAGTSAAAFAQAYSGSLTDAESYTQQLVTSQQQAGAATLTLSQELASGSAGGKAAGESMAASLQTTSVGVQQLAEKVSSGSISMGSLSQANQDAVTHYNQLTNSVNAAKQALSDMQQAQEIALGQLESSSGAFATEAQGASAYSLSLNDVEQAYDGIKENNGKDTLDQVSAAFNSAMVSANQAATAITTSYQQQVQAAAQAATGVDAAAHSYEQAQQSVAAADYGVQQAEQSLAQAQHGVQTAQVQYTDSLDAEKTAQEAVATARQQAAQQLVSLALQQADASASALSANVSLFDAQTAAGALGVTPGNAQAIASEQVTSANEAQVKAAIALIQAQNQLADSQNASTTAQQSLNTAQQQGIDNNPGVVSAQKALEQSTEQVSSAQYALQQAQEQVTNAEYAVTQAHEQVTNALYSQQQAAMAVTTAQNALKTAQQTLADETNLGTVAGQQNEQMILQLASTLKSTMLPQQTQVNDLIQDTAVLFGGSTTAAENFLKQIGAIPQTSKFTMSAVAQVDYSSIEADLHAQGVYINPATATQKADGGPISGPGGPRGDKIPAMLSDGEYVINAASTSQHRDTLDAINAGHYADGGLVGTNAQLGVMGAAYQTAVDALTVVGMPHPAGLPAYVAPANPTVGIAGGVSGSRAGNEAIMQSVFASMFGWTGQQWSDAYQLEMMEAGFNNTAQNPTSTAYGMGQFLNSTWASYGIAKTSDPTLQSEAMGRYIAARYGSPAGALSHENAYHWYAAGGPTSYGTVGINDGGPEAVQLPNGSTVMPAANTAALMQGAAPATDVTMTFAGAVNNGFATLIMNLIRTNQIQLNVNGQRVRVG
ncbi:MAG TPA: hypothetical protein VHX38_18815 [Pseudonocardiaceae bacterium]|jgi:hypothetical protein|nr:hypothetical protein [Pseudonocardiaceae bacterium]